MPGQSLEGVFRVTLLLKEWLRRFPGNDGFFGAITGLFIVIVFKRGGWRDFAPPPRGCFPMSGDF